MYGKRDTHTFMSRRDGPGSAHIRVAFFRFAADRGRKHDRTDKHVYDPKISDNIVQPGLKACNMVD